MATFYKSYEEPPFCEREILRYAGCKTADDEVQGALRSCMEEARPMFRYKVAYSELPLTLDGDRCDFGVFSVSAKQLSRRLDGCSSVIVFAATVGVGIDRLIAKYGYLSPSRAVLMQAIGAERIEALCDVFCEDIAQEYGLTARSRFSPGYGDLPLSVQRDMFAVLDGVKRLGLTLNDSLLMSPSKSVTAFVGLAHGEQPPVSAPCRTCGKHDCAFRRY